jgi:hypothetical protein
VMVDNLPPRVQAAETQAQFRARMDASSLGVPEVKAVIEQFWRWNEALPDRWASLRFTDLVDLLGLYRDHRETWGHDHLTAVAYVLTEVDFEPSQDDLGQSHGQ